MADTFYITTAISYPNGRPHIGHAYEAIAADAIARFHRLAGKDVRLVTGTDEHGLKMVQTARKAGRETQEFADEMSSHFKDMCNKLNVAYDGFRRTTEPGHHEASKALWALMQERGDLYLDRYDGWYSVRDEAFYDEDELVMGEDGQKLSPQGTPVEWTVEETWFFRLSAYQDKLLALYQDNPDFIRPESRRNEVMRFVEGGLKDLSVSRTSFDWGVPVPDSPGHVMYVWVDALTTYMTAVGWPNREGEWAKFWPADIHLIGKDIVRFHTVYWPALLMSAGLPLPKQVFGHGFLLNRGEKMSKSTGNVVDPIALAEHFGVDALRYFLLADVPFGKDGSYSAEAIVTKTNADLANSFGNLAQRTLSMIFKNLDGKINANYEENQDDLALLEQVSSMARDRFPKEFERLNLSVAIEEWLRAVFACNQYVDAQAPWALRKTDPDRMNAVLMTLFRALRPLALAIEPVIPTAAGRLLDQIGASDMKMDDVPAEREWLYGLAKNGFVVSKPEPIFPRIEMPETEDANS